MRLHTKLSIALALIATAAGGAFAEGGAEPSDGRSSERDPTADVAPNENPAPEMEDRRAKTERESKEEAVEIEALPEAQIKQLQVKLESLGHYDSEIDGKFGPKTKQAMRQFYNAQVTLARDGMISREGAAALGVSVSERYVDNAASASLE